VTLGYLMLAGTGIRAEPKKPPSWKVTAWQAAQYTAHSKATQLHSCAGRLAQSRNTEEAYPKGPPGWLQPYGWDMEVASQCGGCAVCDIAAAAAAVATVGGQLCIFVCMPQASWYDAASSLLTHRNLDVPRTQHRLQATTDRQTSGKQTCTRGFGRMDLLSQSN
jgi:hypothetical protein